MKNKILLLMTVAALSAFAGGMTGCANNQEVAHKPAPAVEQKEATLYEQLGGAPAVSAAVDIFYDKVLADDRVNGFFVGVDMDHQRTMQKQFLTYAFGGSEGFSGKDLTQAHSGLVARGLNDSHFDIIVGHLASTLQGLGVSGELIGKVAAVAETVRGPILGKTAAKEVSLYEQLGGAPAVNAAVDIFYDKVLADNRVNGFFVGVDMDHQRTMQKQFMTYAFGGSEGFSGKDLTQAHSGLVARGLNDSHFDIIVGHLASTLQGLGVSGELIGKVAAVAETVRGPILGK